jgi:hypothetical protein
MMNHSEESEFNPYDYENGQKNWIVKIKNKLKLEINIA